jgi:hypothetical protein
MNIFNQLNGQVKRRPNLKVTAVAVPVLPGLDPLCLPGL